MRTVVVRLTSEQVSALSAVVNINDLMTAREWIRIEQLLHRAAEEAFCQIDLTAEKLKVSMEKRRVLHGRMFKDGMEGC